MSWSYPTDYVARCEATGHRQIARTYRDGSGVIRWRANGAPVSQEVSRVAEFYGVKPLSDVAAGDLRKIINGLVGSGDNHFHEAKAELFTRRA